MDGGYDGAIERNFGLDYTIGLFERLRMPFGSKNEPHIYQRLIEHALFGYFKIDTRLSSIASGSSNLIDVFTDGEPFSDLKASVLGRRLYIDDILIPAKLWESLHRKAERPLDVCNR